MREFDPFAFMAKFLIGVFLFLSLMMLNDVRDSISRQAAATERLEYDAAYLAGRARIERGLGDR